MMAEEHYRLTQERYPLLMGLKLGYVLSEFQIMMCEKAKTQPSAASKEMQVYCQPVEHCDFPTTVDDVLYKATKNCYTESHFVLLRGICDTLLEFDSHPLTIQDLVGLDGKHIDNDTWRRVRRSTHVLCAYPTGLDDGEYEVTYKNEKGGTSSIYVLI